MEIIQYQKRSILIYHGEAQVSLRADGLCGVRHSAMKYGLYHLPALTASRRHVRWTSNPGLRGEENEAISVNGLHYCGFNMRDADGILRATLAHDATGRRNGTA